MKVRTKSDSSRLLLPTQTCPLVPVRTKLILTILLIHQLADLYILFTKYASLSVRALTTSKKRPFNGSEIFKPLWIRAVRVGAQTSTAVNANSIKCQLPISRDVIGVRVIKWNASTDVASVAHDWFIGQHLVHAASANPVQFRSSRYTWALDHARKHDLLSAASLLASLPQPPPVPWKNAQMPLEQAICCPLLNQVLSLAVQHLISTELAVGSPRTNQS